jgi:hypothetical protein
VSIDAGAPLTLRPIWNRGKSPEQYSIKLLDGTYVILMRTYTDVWSATEYTPHGPLIDRGLFGTPQDALEVFRAEVTARLMAAATARNADVFPRQEIEMPKSASELSSNTIPSSGLAPMRKHG